MTGDQQGAGGKRRAEIRGPPEGRRSWGRGRESSQLRSARGQPKTPTAESEKCSSLVEIQPTNLSANSESGTAVEVDDERAGSALTLPLGKAGYRSHRVHLVRGSRDLGSIGHDRVLSRIPVRASAPRILLRSPKKQSGARQLTGTIGSINALQLGSTLNPSNPHPIVSMRQSRAVFIASSELICRASPSPSL